MAVSVLPALTQRSFSFSAYMFHAVCAGFSASPRNSAAKASFAIIAPRASAPLNLCRSSGTMIEPLANNENGFSFSERFLKKRSIVPDSIVPFFRRRSTGTRRCTSLPASKADFISLTWLDVRFFWDNLQSPIAVNATTTEFELRASLISLMNKKGIGVFFSLVFDATCRKFSALIIVFPTSTSRFPARIGK